MTSHEEWYAGSPGSRTVSNSNYHAKCAGCVEREKQIAELSAKIADLETQRKEREASYRKWGVLPCPTCQDANARIADLESYYATAMQTPCPDEQHCACVPALQRRIAELEHDLSLAEQGHANAH